MTKIFCHRDADGYCAGAIALHENPEATLQSMQYNEPFPIETIKKHEKVYILDFSLQEPGMFEKLLRKTEDVVWIDHHKTSLGKFDGLIEKYNFKSVLDIEHSGCYITWKHFYGDDRDVPLALLLVEDMDLWKFDWGDETKEFIAGLDMLDKDPSTNPELWDVLLYHDGSTRDSLIDRLENNGRIIIDYKDNISRQLIEHQSFEREWQGYNCIVTNRGLINSDLFKSVWGQYELYISYVYTGENYVVSLYRDEDHAEIDVGAIAKHHGGGGHPGAAGFTVDDDLFVNDGS